MKSNEYYYNNVLNKEQRKTYYAIKEGLLALSSSIMAPAASLQDLSAIYFMIRMDNPEIFYTNTFKYRMYDGSPNIELLPEYMFEKKKIQEHRNAMESRVKKLARQAEKLDEAGKVQFVHDFICQNVTYDKLKKAYSHEIIGALGNGVAVCEGISKGIKILCDALGIWCTIAIAQSNPEKGIKYRHAWNVVKIGGKYYHVDATFDNSVGTSDNIRYDYMCLSDKQIARDHEPIIWRVPECTDNSRSYYREKKLSFTKMEDVFKRSQQAAKKGRVLTFHWRGGY
ncbi:MAG: peptidase, partial [Eubacterium sp.]|nr:peptidase [Candidatus Colimonas fimequi]